MKPPTVKGGFLLFGRVHPPISRQCCNVARFSWHDIALQRQRPGHLASPPVRCAATALVPSSGRHRSTFRMRGQRYRLLSSVELHTVAKRRL
jgi:hypothetical protein